MRTRQVWLIGLVICLHPLSGRAQSEMAQSQQGLMMRGIVRSLTIEPHKSGHYIRVELRLGVTNNGSSPMIFWKYKAEDGLGGLWNKPYVFTGKILSRAPNFSRENVLDSHRGGPSFSGSPAWDAMRKALDRQTPPADVTTILLPNQTLSFDSEVYIVCNQRRGDSIPEQPTFDELQAVGTLWLRVYYEVWSFNLEPNWRASHRPEFGHRLRQRWAKYGTLWLEDIYSEPIQLDLKTATYKTSSR